ncbi:TRAM domain-containing protein [Halobacterium sp. CBA1126]|uniref:TRAM domain-containing protein n=1 Tax=Halobacterium TaxID=2239 RepID=UPI0012F8ECD9|nr:TRAM domain-containing protein [Halobacterium sp. CBA1126]MUV59625.1 TRAM domain-containing protein [Halobacterium sp. CBA1126]
MSEIPDSLRLLYEASLEKRGDQYAITIPEEVVEGSSLTPNDVYRVALLSAGNDEPSGTSGGEAAESGSEDDGGYASPPVEEGEVRSVTIDTLGDQGDGIAKVERGFIVIVPGLKPGDAAEVEITDVKDSVAFAEPVTKPQVR